MKAPVAEITCQEGGAPELAVKTKPAVPELANHCGTPVLDVVRTPSFNVANPVMVLAADE